MEVANELMVRGIVVGVFMENCWVIGNRRTGEAICVDPGGDHDEVLALARDMGVTIKTIANSHAHVDHIMGVHGVRDATDARFLLHESDLDLLRSGWPDGARQMGFDVEQGAPEPQGYVADGDVVHGNERLSAIANHAGGLRAKVHQSADRFGGAPAGADFQDPAQKDKGDDHG